MKIVVRKICKFFFRVHKITHISFASRHFTTDRIAIVTCVSQSGPECGLSSSTKVSLEGANPCFFNKSSVRLKLTPYDRSDELYRDFLLTIKLPEKFSAVLDALAKASIRNS